LGLCFLPVGSRGHGGGNGGHCTGGGHGTTGGGLTIFDLMRIVRIDASHFPFTIFGNPSAGTGSSDTTSTNNIKQTVAEMFSEVVEAIKNNITINFNNTTQLDGRNIASQLRRVKTSKVGVW